MQPKPFFSFLCLSTASVFSVQAQQSLAWYENQLPWKEGMQLFLEKNYLSARGKFESIKNALTTYQDNDSWVFRQQIDFYIAASASEGYEKDAGKLLRAFVEQYPDSRYREKVNFLLGRELYRESNYAEAAEKLALVKDASLSEEELTEKNFILGYSYFTKKKFEEAKPLFKAIKSQKGKYFYPANYYYGFICFYLKDYAEALKSFQGIEDSKLYAPVLPYYIAQLYYLKTDYARVAPYVEKVITREEVLYKDELRHLQGKAYFQLSEFGKAFPLLDAYVKNHEKVSKEDLFQLSYCQYRAGKCQEAIPTLKTLSLLDEAIGQSAAYALGDCYLQLSKKEEARAAFQSAASRKFDAYLTENALYQYAKLTYESGNPSEAIQSFEAYLTQFPSGAYRLEVNELLGMALVQTRDYEKAYKLIEQLQISSKALKEAYQKVTYYRAVELFHDQQTEACKEMLDKSLRFAIDPAIEALSLYLKGEVLYQQQSYNEAIACFNRFATLYRSDAPNASSASLFRANYNIGYCYFKQKAYFRATTYFGKAVDEIPNSPDKKGIRSLESDLYLRYADCAFISKEYDKALDAYTKIAANRWPQSDYALFRKSILKGIKNDDAGKIAELENLLRSYPETPLADKAWFEIGETELDRSRYTQAAQAYKKVMDEYPMSALLPKAHLQRALSLFNNGQKNESIEAYKKLIRNHPDTKEAGIALATLKAIYVEDGKVDEFFDFAGNAGVAGISKNEQDSLSYRTALNFYEEGNAARATELFSGYLNKFPSGYFAEDAHFLRADLYLRSKKYAEAEADYSSLIAKKNLEYLEKSLLNAAEISYFELQEFEKANQYYGQLLEVAGNSDNKYIAKLGLTRTYHLLGNYPSAANYATSLIDEGIREKDKAEVYTIRANARLKNNELPAALNDYVLISRFSEGERAADAAYQVAKILNAQQKYQASLDSCLQIRNHFASYEKTIVRTFILMADNYNRLGKAFQAQATLESIVNNYTGDETLVKEAREKLELIRQEQLQKSKLMESPPQDSLMLEEKLPGK